MITIYSKLLDNMINLKDILFEVAPEIAAKYGDVLFGEEPKFVKLQSAHREQNTSVEDKLQNALINWYAGYGFFNNFDKSAAALYKYKTELLKLKNEYPEIVKPPKNGTKIYRGITEESKNFVPIIEFAKRINPKGTLNATNYSGLIFKNIKYKPHRNVTSWSTKIFEDTYPIYLIGQVDDNCIMSPKASNIFYSHQRQYEIIHFDNFKYPIDTIINKKYLN